MAAFELFQGDCLEVLPTIPSGSIDCIIADPPYGTTACKWDTVIPLAPMWEQLKRVIKPRGAIVLFAGQPFTSVLIGSNIRQFKYCWTWDKKTGKGHLVAKYRPMQQTEDICVFGQGAIRYFPEMTLKDKPDFAREGSRTSIMGGKMNGSYTGKWNTHSYPKTILHFPWSPVHSFHPTQKPVDLLRYLVRTYTNAGEAILDFTIGSGSTGVAALLEGRHIIGIEKEAEYCTIARQRMEEAASEAAGSSAKERAPLPLLEGLAYAD